MTRIYISDDGDEKNDGLTRETAIYSWKREVKLCDGGSGTKSGTKNEYRQQTLASQGCVAEVGEPTVRLPGQRFSSSKILMLARAAQ